MTDTKQIWSNIFLVEQGAGPSYIELRIAAILDGGTPEAKITEVCLLPVRHPAWKERAQVEFDKIKDRFIGLPAGALAIQIPGE